MAADLIVIMPALRHDVGVALAVENGATVIVLDDQAGPGGQIYRGVEGIDGGQDTILGEDAIIGRDIARRFCASGARYRRGSTVWQVTDDLEIAFSGSGWRASCQSR